MSDPYENCTKVTPDCPVSETTYGYAPSLGGNAIYAVIFAVCALIQLVFVFKYWRQWKGFSILVCVGCIGEAGGYVARIFLHNNPWSGGPMSIQFVLLMVAPSFLAAALYMTLRTLVQFFGPEHTRLAERFWTWPFVTADTVGFLMQCGGGIMASAGEVNPALATAGVALMITGVTLQAVVMGIAGVLAIDFALRYRRRQGRGAFRLLTGNLALFLLSMSLAFLLILARCIYRIPELAGGVGGALMRQEVEFMIFDGL
ncbi:uncharacterized protein LTR77_006898 [Saxophila tyrrhenica]|uniref:Uncharacterized protein n=1 Tax=Saxophila tyrrhenica TaxID=1690608 RepID=A0AAV9P641_9PEZI|nr:hypothetical protein LTR77_006898 [Saxophila tyrrhenica]